MSLLHLGVKLFRARLGRLRHDATRRSMMQEWITQFPWLQHAAFYLIALVWPVVLIQIFTEREEE